MATTYIDCPEEVRAMLDGLIGEYRGDLAAAGVTIRLQFAVSDNDKPALTAGGYPALGLCRINDVRVRAEGLTDATITLDGDRWPRLSPRRQLALLHHELHHIQLGKGVDAAGRPRLRCRKHDVEMGLFAEITQEYREDSVEWALIDMAVGLRQKQSFDFGKAGGE